MQLRWIIGNDCRGDEIQSLAETLRIPPVMAQILISRGIRDLESAQRFFRPSLDQLYDPFLLTDMDKGVERLRRAVLSDERILIYGDYDVDGITSVSFLYMILKEIGASVFYYIPDRRSEGYGLSEKGIKGFAEQGINLIVTVDCGVTGHEEIELARTVGIDVIVSDHHEPGPTLPAAVAVIDPKRHDCQYPFKELAGVGVSYKLAQGLLQRMGIDSSILEHYLEFVAIGTSADIVPLIDENRLFVKTGMQKLNSTENIGLKALINVAALYGREISTGHIVFIIAPRINAVGRLGDAERAVKLLTTEDEAEARAIANILEMENRHRKDIDEGTFREALVSADELFDSEHTRSLVLAKEGWHSGVIGIVASRVAERFYRPTVLISIEDGIGKGSARSIDGFDLFQAIKSCEDLLVAYGGHKYAAGLTIEEKNIPAFRERFEEIARQKLSPDMLIPKLNIDAEIHLDQIDEQFLKLLKRFAPFGPKNMRPVFVSKNLHVVGTPTIVGTNHLKLRVGQGRQTFDVIGFNMGEWLQRLISRPASLDMAYVIDENDYLGRRYIQLRVKDLQ
ncbi:MAG TPA: single-stranded-DNA-specific exonuclease RecJ [bacterium]|nr:single-stranded-DNA-specific exonuclease RecJ [bacterium]HNT64912.1 single-stranded-DNA-specific exonuclease RecJ [bacterium]HOX84921.1 single-stranded-DNA-specific exonuclease RecJ [bacterium]HPG44213.1 single-stranded-DNA-specific exonuclease RecJ [bacterium]HPM96580.1 single-stranded-DNA-specific exonuclease RecJ [bacterium]